jgi:hypothetical protein
MPKATFSFTPAIFKLMLILVEYQEGEVLQLLE